MFPHPSPLRARLDAGQSIHGLYIQMPSPDIVELAAAAGYDYVILDEEHGSFDYPQTLQMIRAAEASGVCPLVRVPSLCPSRIRKALEAGALGVYVPDIRSAAQARMAVAAIKFGRPEPGSAQASAPSAGRGACPTVRASRGIQSSWESFVRWNDENVLACLLIESQEGLDDLDAILAVPGLDIVLLGRFDLAHEMGLYGHRYGAEMNAVFEDFAARAQRAGIPYVARLKSADPAEARAECAEWLRRGARIFNVGSDREFAARALRDALAPLQAASRHQTG